MPSPQIFAMNPNSSSFRFISWRYPIRISAVMQAAVFDFTAPPSSKCRDNTLIRPRPSRFTPCPLHYSQSSYHSALYRLSYWLGLQTKIGRLAFFSQRSPVHNWIINSAVGSEIIWRRSETIQRRSPDCKPPNAYPKYQNLFRIKHVRSNTMNAADAAASSVGEGTACIQSVPGGMCHTSGECSLR